MCMTTKYHNHTLQTNPRHHELHSTSKLLFDLPLFAPVIIRMAAFVYHLVSCELLADAYACKPYSILLIINVVYRLMKPKWQKLASRAQEICTLWFQFFGAVFASKGYPFKNIF